MLAAATNRAGKGMGRSNELGWAWKPGPGDGSPLSSWEERRKRKRKRERKAKRKNRLLYAPGEVFYESKAWKRLRRQVLEKYGWKCMRCDAVDAVIQVDHIEPRSLKPELSLTFSNLQVLCRECNKLKSNLYSYDYRTESAMRDFEVRLALEARRVL